ncbi:MAG: baeRF11 domain-containing protein [Xanthobacteraceae bacterium]
MHEAGFDKRRRAALEQQFDHLAGADEDNVQDQDHIRKLQNKKPSEAEGFWRSQTHGLGVLSTPETLRKHRLPYAPKPLAEVANRFHLTPLIRAMTSPQDVFVLALSEESVRLVHAFVNLPAVQIKVPQLPHAAEDATRRPSIHVRAPRDHLQNLEGEKVFLQKYARQVDHAVCTALAGRTVPLVLAAAQPIASVYRAVNGYPYLLDEGMLDSDHMSIPQLADAALPILDRLYAHELKSIIARYDELKPRRATADVSYAAHAATAGAVEQLLVDLDAVIPGLVSEYDGSVTYAASDDAETYSVVDEVARRALCTGAHVLGARREELPDRAPLIAILRYQFGTIAS